MLHLKSLHTRNQMSYRLVLKKGSDTKALLTGNPRYLRFEKKQANNYVEPLDFDKSGAQHILMTGANGFVGMHILHNLLVDKRIERVFVLMRPRTGVSLERKLRIASRPYGINLPNDNKIVYLSGDISQPHLGLSDETWQMLAREATMVIHSASSTNHAYPYSFYRRTSVRALLDLVELCTSFRKKQLHTMGSVGCEAFQTFIDFYRVDFYRCGYTKMKWIVKHLTDALQVQGVDAFVYMSPFVLGGPLSSYKDPGLHYSFWQMVKFAVDVRCIWGATDILIPVIAADDLAQAIIENAFSSNPMVWNYPALKVTGPDLAEALGLEIETWKNFRKLLLKKNSFLPRRFDDLVPTKKTRRRYQNSVYARGLYPQDFPKLINASSRVTRELQRGLQDSPDKIKFLRSCAQANHII